MARRCRLVAAIGLLSSVFVLAACSSQSSNVREAVRAGEPVTQPPRSARGNPPFYDVLGKRYYVRASSAGYREQGVASWYGRDFHGLSTSSGEIYDMNAMTAAHTTLPLPTWVEVTNLENGRRTIVKVNDRGPFVDNRIIDLSYAAAQEIDMVRNGTARVEVRALGAPAATLTAAASSPSAAQAPPGAPLAMPSTGIPGAALGVPSAGAIVGASAAPPPTVAGAGAERMYVQIGAFGERANAERLVGQLRGQGFANAGVASDASAGVHRVRVGPLASASEFDAIRARLAALGMRDTHLVVDR